VNSNNESHPSVPSLLLFPISALSCPYCTFEFSRSCEDLSSVIVCPDCNRQIVYIDAFLNHYRRRPDIFIDPIHPIPIAPGYTVGGEIRVIPDELQLTPYGVNYNRPPELFFLDDNNRPLRDLILKNHYIAAVSISTDSFIVLSRTFDRELETPDPSIRWMAIGEVGEHEKPIWNSILQNAADLILKSEEKAAVVMLQIALDFFYDETIRQMGFSSKEVKAASRRWKVSDRRTKIKLLENRFGSFPKQITDKLVDLAEQRNQVVHGKIERPEARQFSAREGFKVILEALITMNDMKYAYIRRENVKLKEENAT
jgi:hypothetical protein